MLSAAAFNFQAVLPSEALSCELGRRRFFAKTVKLKSLGMGFAETNMPHEKLELLREAILVGRLSGREVKPYSSQDSCCLSSVDVHNQELSPGIRH